MSSNARVIRVFISSTFRDMQAERDHLVKVVFPQLRRLCEQRNVIWSEVDLRWGITNEQKAEGQVLPICLEEIQRCRPYFIGLLGERYGWIPESIDSELIEREPWLVEQLDHSVTELEILHGVLNNPEMSERALFYFRDPHYIETLSSEERDDFVEVPWREDIEEFGMEEALKRVQARKAKLMALKERIRASQFPLKENYPDPRTLGDWVLHDMTAIIDELYPEGSQPDVVQQEQIGQRLFTISQSKVYVGGKQYFNQLDDFARGTGTQPLVVVGETGVGKSALLVNWGLQYQAEHPDELVLTHFVGATTMSRNWGVLLAMLMAGLKDHFYLKEEIPRDPDVLRSAFPNWLSSVSKKGKVVLILDALDRLDDREGAQELIWLPAQLPENISMVISTMPGKVLRTVQQRNYPMLTVEPLLINEAEKLVHTYLAQYSKQLNQDQVQRIIADPQSSNPLALRVLLDELRQFGDHDRLDIVIDKYLKADSIPEMFDLILERCELDFEGERPDLVRDALCSMWACRSGVSEAELLDLLGRDGSPLPHRDWAPLYFALQQSLFDSGGLLNFYHDYIRQAVERRYLPAEEQKKAAREEMASYFSARKENPSRRLHELPWLYMQAQEWEKLYDLLSDLDFLKDLWQHNTYDLISYWAMLEEHSDFTRVQAYHSLLENPERYDVDTLMRISYLLRNSAYFSEAMQLYQAGERISRENGDLESLSQFLNDQALVFSDWGRLDEAIQCLRETEDLLEQLGKKEGLVACRLNRAVILEKQGHLQEAMDMYKELEHTCRERGDLERLTAVLGNQALILKDWGKLPEAMQLFKEQQFICYQTGNQEDLHTCLGNQSEVLDRWGRKEEALELVEEKERICRRLGNLDGLQSALRRKASLLDSWGRMQEAMPLLQEAEHICRQLGKQESLQYALGSQADILRKWGRLEEALRLHEEQEKICQTIGDLAGVGSTMGNKALTLRMLGRLEEAMQANKEEERICRQLGDLFGLQRSLGNQSKILISQGDLTKAMKYLKEQERISRQLENPFGLLSSLGNQSIIMQKRGRWNEALELSLESERLCRQINNPQDLAINLYQQTIIRYQRGETGQARRCIDEALEIARKHGYHNLIGQFETVRNNL